MRYGYWMIISSVFAVSAAAGQPIVEVTDFSLKDPGRSDKVKTQIFLPGHKKKVNTVLLSPDWLEPGKQGLKQAQSFARMLAARGWAVVLMQHQDTKARIDDRKNWKRRAMDAGFLVNILPWREALLPQVLGRMDTTKFAVVGIGAGGFAALALAGAELQDRKLFGLFSFKDDRVGAFAAIQPPGEGSFGLHAGSWGSLGSGAILLADCPGVKNDSGNGKKIFDRISTGKNRVYYQEKSPKCESSPTLIEKLDQFLRLNSR